MKLPRHTRNVSSLIEVANRTRSGGWSKAVLMV